MGNEKNPTFEELLEQLKDEDFSVKIEVVVTLGKLKDNKALDPLEKSLNQELENISNLKSKQIIQIYHHYHMHKNTILNKIEETILLLGGRETYQDIRYVLAPITASAIRDLGENNNQLLLNNMLNFDTNDWDVRDEIFDAIDLIKLKENRDKLGTDDEQETKKQEVNVLLESIAENFKYADKDEYVDFSYKIQNLANKYGTLALEPLVDMCENIEDVYTGFANDVFAHFAKYTFEKFENFEVTDKIEKASQSKHANLREGITLALGNIENPKTEEILIKLLKDSEKNVRIAAIRSLGKESYKAALEQLIPLLEVQDVFIYRAAVQTISIIDSVKILDTSFNNFKRTNNVNILDFLIPVIKKIHSEEFDQALDESLNKLDSDTKFTIYMKLAKKKVKRVIEPLRQLLKEEQDPKVKEIIEATLQEL